MTFFVSDSQPFAQELVGLQPDIILASAVGTAALQWETQTIPIVVTTGGDPVASGIVERLNQPGGNITGFGTLAGCGAVPLLQEMKHNDGRHVPGRPPDDPKPWPQDRGACPSRRECSRIHSIPRRTASNVRQREADQGEPSGFSAIKSSDRLGAGTVTPEGPCPLVGFTLAARK
jgi:hypothetical protein